jgi:L-ascorbate metabolism protein UlaG (beta-lactamase superfamily)
MVVGTESTAHVLRAAGIGADRIVVARPSSVFTLGPFRVQAVGALHSLTGVDDAPIAADVSLPMPARAYGEGGTLQYRVLVAGHEIYFVGTANFREDRIRDVGAHPDVAIVATGLRRKIERYTCRLLDALGHPKLVLPNHFDGFRAPLRPGPVALDEDARADIDAFVGEAAECSPGTQVLVPEHLRAIRL